MYFRRGGYGFAVAGRVVSRWAARPGGVSFRNRWGLLYERGSVVNYLRCLICAMARGTSERGAIGPSSLRVERILFPCSGY